MNDLFIMKWKSGFTVFVFLLMIVLGATAQPRKKIRDVSSNMDCADLRWIKAENRIGPTNGTVGFGNTLEIKNPNYRIPHYFEREHTVVWYGLVAQDSGLLELDIVPVEASNDLDFMVFKWENGLCNKIPKAVPLRSCISRVDTSNYGITGLKWNTKKRHIRSGPGDSYVFAIPVKPGDSLVLAIDNLAEKGKGHFINFKYSKSKPQIIRGRVLDSDNGKPIKATVSLLGGVKQDTVFTTYTDSKGNYELDLDSRISVRFPYLTLNIDASNYFFSDTLMLVQGVAVVKVEPRRIQRLKKGRRFRIKNILFHGNVDTPLSISFAVFDRILRLMNRHEKMEILIEGHVNGCQSDPEFSQQLSEDRAARVKKYLVKNGIDPDRVATIGHGCRKMLYERPKSKYESQLNRRVEILITDF